MSGPAATSRYLPFISNTPTVPVHGQVVEAVGAGVRPPLIGPPGGASAGRPGWTVADNYAERVCHGASRRAGARFRDG